MLPRKAPRYLYKYCPVNQYSIQSIKEGQIWFGRPKNLNDPYDMQIDYMPVDPRKIKRRHLKLLAEIPADFSRLEKLDEAINGKKYRHIVHTMKVGNLGVEAILGIISNPEMLSFPNSIGGVHCLTTVAGSPVMWSHYAERSTGMMIQYASKNVCKVKRMFRVGELEFAPVRYTNKLPTMTILDWIEDYNKTRLASCLTKHLDWSYEREWRLIANRGDQLVDNPFDITSISMGTRSTTSNRLEVYSICQAINAKFYLCAKHPINYGQISIRIMDEDSIEKFDGVDLDEFVKTQLGIRKPGADAKVQLIKISS